MRTSMKTEYPYGERQNAYLNVKEAARAPWRGITAWIQGSPYLIIDKDDNDIYTVEGEDGSLHRTGQFQRWTAATDHSRLVAASRLENSPFVRGAKVGSFEVGNLVYFEKEWQVHTGTEFALPLEDLIEQYASQRWDKNADIGLPDFELKCPKCGSRDIETPRDGESECYDCGFMDHTEQFMNEAPEPDYDQSREDWSGPENSSGDDNWGVWQSAKTAEDTWNSFDYQLPPGSLHMRTHAALGRAGLQARVHFPPELTGSPGPFGSVPPSMDMPSQDFSQVGPVMMIDNPEQYTVKVETPHDPNEVRRIFDELGGRRMASWKLTTINQPSTVNEDGVLPQKSKAVKCPSCGSHTIRFYNDLESSTGTLVCLRCGNEFNRPIINIESSVTDALDPNLHAQILAIQQQIDQAYQSGDTTKAQQLNQQLQQLLNNPTQQPTNGMNGVNALSALVKEAPGKEHMKGVSPKRNRQYEHIKEQLMDSGRSEEEAKEEAARTVNKQRAEHGETKKGDVDKEAIMGGNITCPQCASMMNSHDPYCANCGTPNTYQRPGLLDQIKDKVVPPTTPAVAKVDNSNLPDTPAARYNLDSPEFTFQVQSWFDGADDPVPQPVQHEDLDSYEDPGLDLDYAHCPACDGPGVLLGQLGSRIHYRCRNCGVDFSHALEQPSAYPGREEPYGQDEPEAMGAVPSGNGNLQDESQDYPASTTISSFEDAKEVNQNTLRVFNDSTGSPLEAGRRYYLRHPKYPVPDVVKILNLEDNRIEAAIDSDDEAFPIHITHEDAYSLDPYEDSDIKTARRNYSAQEQRELIDENPKGLARNFDKLNLENTHYRVEATTDPYFLLGI